MSEIKMLPLPGSLSHWLKMRASDSEESAVMHVAVHHHARAVAEHNVKKRDAEIESLRAVRDSFQRVGIREQERAERLAEALRRAEGLLRSAGIIADADLERPHSAATEIKNALRDHDKE